MNKTNNESYRGDELQMAARRSRDVTGWYVAAFDRTTGKVHAWGPYNGEAPIEYEPGNGNPSTDATELRYKKTAGAWDWISVPWSKDRILKMYNLEDFSEVVWATEQDLVELLNNSI